MLRTYNDPEGSDRILKFLDQYTKPLTHAAPGVEYFRGVVVLWSFFLGTRGLRLQFFDYLCLVVPEISANQIITIRNQNVIDYDIIVIQNPMAASRFQKLRAVLLHFM